MGRNEVTTYSSACSIGEKFHYKFNHLIILRVKRYINEKQREVEMRREGMCIYFISIWQNAFSHVRMVTFHYTY